MQNSFLIFIKIVVKMNETWLLIASGTHPNKVLCCWNKPVYNLKREVLHSSLQLIIIRRTEHKLNSYSSAKCFSRLGEGTGKFMLKSLTESKPKGYKWRMKIKLSFQPVK